MVMNRLSLSILSSNKKEMKSFIHMRSTNYRFRHDKDRIRMLHTLAEYELCLLCLLDITRCINILKSDP